MRAFAVLLILAYASPALGEEKPVLSWLMLPVDGDRPPPSDPTLLRMSKKLSVAVKASISGPVKVVSRDKRDEFCVEGCPEEIAGMLETDRVIELRLAGDYGAVSYRIYRSPRGLVSEGQIPCAWQEGRVECDAKKLKAELTVLKGFVPLDKKAVERAFAGLKPTITRCFPKHLRKTAAKREATVQFRVRPAGTVRDVRVDPQRLRSKKGYACVARAVESLRVPAFSGKQPVRFQFPLELSLAE